MNWSVIFRGDSYYMSVLNVNTLFKRYLSTITLFFILDMIWLIVISPEFYSRHIGHLMTKNVDWVAVILFYLLYSLGLFVFVIIKTNPLNRWRSSLKGTFFGLITYATFDLTNQAMMKDWPWIVTIVDLFWGMFICGLTTYLVTLISVLFETYSTELSN